MRKILLLLCFIFCSSCETLITDLKDNIITSEESKLVVYSFICPQSNIISVVVSESTPLFTPYTQQNNVIEDAIVTISDGKIERILMYDSLSRDYQLSANKFAIRAGQTYTLKVSDKTRQVHATCTVPTEQVTIKSYEIDSIKRNKLGYIDSSLVVQLAWQDIPKQKNYYRIRAFAEIEYSILEQDGPNHFTERITKTLHTFDWEDLPGKSDLYTDENLDGSTIESSKGTFNISEKFIEILDYKLKKQPKVISLKFELLHTDAAYYEYHRALYQYRNMNNPFSEPILISSNIEGGLGCFAGFNSKQIQVRR